LGNVAFGISFKSTGRQNFQRNFAAYILGELRRFAATMPARLRKLLLKEMPRLSFLKYIGA
jgi:hypothetical protein